MACFPFPTEVPALMAQFVAWLRAPPEGPGLHPFLRACDIFLVAAHLHPFMDETAGWRACWHRWQ
jgi:Fic family protein